MFMNIRNRNNFDVLRFFAAVLVLFSHSFPLATVARNEPIALWTNGQTDGGKIAVSVFFILSGFLITASWNGKRNIREFLIARTRRIFPGLAVMLVVTTIFGAFVTSSASVDYWYSALEYFIKNLTIYKGKESIVGVFEFNPYGSVINGSLWTLRHEFSCYLLIAFFGAIGYLRPFQTWVLWLICIFLVIYQPLHINFFKEFAPLGVWFISGALAYFYKDVAIKLPGLLVGFITIICLFVSGFGLMAASPVVAYLLIRLCYIPGVFSNFGKYGDFSYGIYIYAFPVQQFVVYLVTKSILSPMDWWVVFGVSFPITFCFAVASWYLVEKRFLKRRVVLT